MSDKDYDDLDKILASLDEPLDDSYGANFNTKDRDPVTEAVKETGKSALGRIFPRGRRDEVILKALPDSYGEANDNFREIKYTASDLYSHTKEELVATERHLQRKAQMLAPRIRKFLPGKLGKKFDQWTEDDGSYGYGWNNDVEEQRNQQINSLVEETFRPKEQFVASESAKRIAKEEETQESNDKAKDEIRQFVSDNRQMQMAENLANIQLYLERMTMEGHAVMGWRRKTLEVGLRQLFVMSDVVSLIKGANDRVIPAIEAIVKNTALPDYAKETTGEIAMAMAKRRLVEATSPAEWSRNFFQSFAENTRRRVSEIANDTRSAMDYLDMAAMQDDFEDEELTPEQKQAKAMKQGGGILGHLLAEKFIVPARDKVLSKVKEVTSKNDRVNALGQKVKYYTGNVSSLYNTELTDETEDSVLKSLVGMLSEIKGGYNGEQLGLGDRGEQWLNSPAVNDNRLYVTQTEIIPAYLRSIDQAVWKLNGEERDNVYDITTRGFVSSEDFNRLVRKQVGRSTQKELYDGGLEKLVREFDVDNELSEAGKARLKEYFHERVSKNLTFDIKSLASMDNFQEIMSDYDDNEVFERRIEEMADEDLFGNMNHYADRFKRLRNMSGGYQNEINRLAMLHGDKALVDAGIFTRNDFGGLDVDKALTDPSVRYENEYTRPAERPTTKDVVRNFAEPKYSAPQFTPTFDNVNVEADMSPVTSKLDEVISAIRETSIVNKFDSLLELGRVNQLDLRTVIELMREMKEKGVPGVSVEQSEEGEGRFDKVRRFGGKAGTSIFNFGKCVFTKGWKGLGSAASWGREKLRRGKAGAKDIYDEHGERLLSGARLKAGEYYVKIGDKLRRIYSIDEIDGEVFDKDGNSILTNERLKEAGKLRFMSNGRWAKVSDYISGKFTDGVKGTLRLGGRGFDLTGRALSATKSFMMGPPDIYVEGENKPRLRAELIRKGFYFCNGSVIKSVDDITGEVKDADGRIIISEDDFNAPGFKLIDQLGNPVKTRLQKVRGFFADNIRKNTSRLFAAGRYLKNKATGAVKGVKNWWDKRGGNDEEGEEKPSLLQRVFGKGVDVSSRAREYDVLVKIYNLLNQRMPGTPGEDLPERGRTFDTDKVKDVINRGKENIKSKFEKTKSKFEEKAEEFDTKTAKHRRFARMKGNRAKRSVVEQFKRNRRAAEIKAKRVQRDFKREVEGSDTITASAKTAKKHIINPVSNFISQRVGKAANAIQGKFRKPLDAPTDKFSGMDSGIKVPHNDPQLELLKRIADSSEGTWIRGLVQESDALGIDSSFKQRMLLGFSKKFKGSISRLYRGMASAKPGEDKEEGLSFWDKVKGKLGRDKKEDGKDGFMAKIGEMMLGMGAVIKGGLSTILSGIASKIGLTAAKNMAGTLLATGAGGLKGAAVAGASALGGMLMTGAKAAAGAILPFAAKSIAAIGSVISAPVALGVAAVAVLGWVAYKHLTRKKPSIVGRVRFAQYGTREYDTWSEDDAIKMIYLEEELKRYLRKGPSGMVIQGLSKEKATELAIGYGVEEGNEVELQAFQSYLIHRFIPIYLLWQTRMADYAISGSTQDLETNGVSLETQKKLINGTRLTAQHPIYQDRIDPDRADRGLMMRFSDWVGFTNRQLLNGDEVTDITARALQELDALIEEQKNRKEREEKKDKVRAKMLDDAKRRHGVLSERTSSSNPYTSNNPTAEAALRAMAGDRNSKGPRHLGDIKVVEGGEKGKIEISQTTPISNKDIYPVEIGRFALYGMENPTKEATMAIREVERIASATIDTRTRIVDSLFYERALPHLTKLGSGTREQYGEKSTDYLNAWLRDRFVPMYIAYRESLGKIVGGGAVMTPNLSMDVYSALVALVDTKVSISGTMVSVVKLPQEVEILGDYYLLKDGQSISSVLQRIKPSEKAAINEKDTVKQAPAKKVDGLRQRDQRSGASGIDRIRSELSDTVSDIKKERSTPTVSIRDVKIDPENKGDAEYGQFSNVSLRSQGDVALLIAKIAEAQGFDPELLLTTAFIESSLNPNARPISKATGKALSSAEGLFQFIDSTWKEQMEKHGNRLGIPKGTPKNDPVANTLLAIEYFKSNSKVLGENQKSAVDLYMTHFMGADGAKKFLKAYQSNPDAPAAKYFASEAASNPSVFYDKSGRPKSLADIYNGYAKKFVSGSSHIKSLTGGMYGGNLFSQTTRDVLENDTRRQGAIVEKATLDANLSKPSSNVAGYTAIAPGGKSMPTTTPATSSIDAAEVKRRGEEFEKSNKGVSEADRSRYEEALTEAYSKPTPAQSEQARNDTAGALERYFEKATTHQTTVGEQMKLQTGYQEQMVTLLGHIYERLGVSNNTPRESRQMELDHERERKRVNLPVDLSHKTVNVSRNRDI